MSDLDTFGMTRATDPDTSFEAAGKVAPHVRELQAKVGKRLLEVYPDGLTHWEIEEHFGDHGSTYRTRVSELCEMIPPLARNSGRRRHIPGGTAWCGSPPSTTSRWRRRWRSARSARSSSNHPKMRPTWMMS
jgi:hypothetical protein